MDKTVKTNPQFGDMPATELLGLLGHTKTNLSVRWAFRESDGLRLQSQYGILRISPVASGRTSLGRMPGFADYYRNAM